MQRSRCHARRPPFPTRAGGTPIGLDIFLTDDNENWLRHLCDEFSWIDRPQLSRERQVHPSCQAAKKQLYACWQGGTGLDGFACNECSDAIVAVFHQYTCIG